MYYLDTNICIYFMKGTNENITKKLCSLNPKEIKIPAIVKSELLYGAYKSERKAKNIAAYETFLKRFEIENYTDEMSYAYATIRSELEIKGNPIGYNDLLIASTVLSKGGILVTNNEKEFSRIPGLKIENWTK